MKSLGSCHVVGKKQVNKASGRQFHFLKEQQKLVPEALQNIESVAWNLGNQHSQSWHNQACAQVHLGSYPQPGPLCVYTHSHACMHRRIQLPPTIGLLTDRLSEQVLGFFLVCGP